ncbi:protein TAPETUM DETERMINANT 1-like [Neltuma alba]|uniref:protein TAPETUM DETERMINANT 1-like n=1 Tax=Neltuma alba TaxID=207710 RepID=UPI0010A59217|nr:protein TAPETUM DETERMINANT 1-like [Prosopis alba]XP_028783372.1 protein TAPETUM DETERMINANT 1-like [Prosopis alba]
MAASTTQILATLFLLLGLIAHGKATNCSLRDISVSQSKTGAIVQNKPEWMVTIENKCTCVQLNLKLKCNGFQTVENIDPSVFQVSSDGLCLVNNGQPVYTKPITFKYAWDNSFPLTPSSSTIACS